MIYKVDMMHIKKAPENSYISGSKIQGSQPNCSNFREHGCVYKYTNAELLSPEGESDDNECPFWRNLFRSSELKRNRLLPENLDKLFFTWESSFTLTSTTNIKWLCGKKAVKLNINISSVHQYICASSFFNDLSDFVPHLIT